MEWLNNLIADLSVGKTADELQAESDALDAKRRGMNIDKFLSDDQLVDSWLAQTEENDTRSVQHVQQDMTAGFNEGLQDGARNLKGAAGNTGSLVPWWAWVLIVIVVVMYLGLGRNLFAKASA